MISFVINPFGFGSCRASGSVHHMTAFVPELGCLGVTWVSFKAVSSFCMAAFASSLAVLM